MSWDLSYSCCSSLVPIRTEQAWQKKCHTKSSTKPTDMWSQGHRLWKKEGESSQWWGTTPPRCAAARAGTTVGVLWQSSSTCSSLFPEMKLQPNVVLSKCKVVCLHCRSDVFVFLFTFPWCDLLLFCSKIKHIVLFSYSVNTHPFIYTWATAACACIGAQECIHLYIANATVFAKL